MSTILVVDDEPTVLNLCQRMLQVGGYEVLQAPSGEAAIRLVRDPQNSIDLALIDVMMPIMNGIELAARLKAAQPALPIVLMTGFTIREIERIVADHPYRIIWKPFKTDSLLRMIENALGESTATV